MGDLVHAWDRRSNEPGDWYDRFDRFFRAQGPERSMNQAYRAWYNEKHGYDAPAGRQCPTDWWHKSKEWEWKDRAGAWDEYIWEEMRAVEEDGLREMRDRHISESRAIQKKALEALAKMDIDDPGLAIRAFRQMAQMERQARGLSESMVDYEDMTDEDLMEAYQREFERAGPSTDQKSDEAQERADDEGLTPSDDRGRDTDSDEIHQ